MEKKYVDIRVRLEEGFHAEVKAFCKEHGRYLQHFTKQALEEKMEKIKKKTIKNL